MKPSYAGFEAKKTGGFTELPPAGCYVAEIKNVKFIPQDGKNTRDRIECYIDIIEGDYTGRYVEVWNDQKERFGDDAKFKGIFNLIPPTENDEDWRRRAFEGNLWCVQESNAGYAWDWDEKKLKGKKVGINVRNRLYTYNGKNRQTTEIGKFETVEDVRNGKCKPMRDRDNRDNKEEEESTDGSSFTDVSKNVEVPW